MIDTCSWDHPGDSPYIGTPRAAIEAMASIPAPIRAVLIARAERRDFDDIVFIDRDSIRSRTHEYEPSLREMHFGAQGRICTTVTRAGWSDRHVESAMVFCSGSWCVARPSVCNNWSIITRLARRPVGDRPDGIALLPVAVGPPATVLIADPQMPSGPVVSVGQPALADGSVGPAFNTFTDASYAYGGIAFPSVPHQVVAVAEPSTYALLLAGLAAMVLVNRKRA